MPELNFGTAVLANVARKVFGRPTFNKQQGELYNKVIADQKLIFCTRYPHMFVSGIYFVK